MISATKCRLCLRDKTCMTNIYEYNLKCSDLNTIECLYWMFGVEVDYDDGKSKLICTRCINLVELIAKYRKKFQENQLFWTAAEENTQNNETHNESFEVPNSSGSQPTCEVERDPQMPSLKSIYDVDLNYALMKEKRAQERIELEKANNNTEYVKIAIKTLQNVRPYVQLDLLENLKEYQPINRITYKKVNEVPLKEIRQKYLEIKHSNSLDEKVYKTKREIYLEQYYYSVKTMGIRELMNDQYDFFSTGLIKSHYPYIIHDPKHNVDDLVITTEHNVLVCEFCSACFSYAAALQMHIRHKHGNTFASNDNLSRKKPINNLQLHMMKRSARLQNTEIPTKRRKRRTLVKNNKNNVRYEEDADDEDDDLKSKLPLARLREILSEGTDNIPKNTSSESNGDKRVKARRTLFKRKRRRQKPSNPINNEIIQSKDTVELSPNLVIPVDMNTFKPDNSRKKSVTNSSSGDNRMNTSASVSQDDPNVNDSELGAVVRDNDVVRDKYSPLNIGTSNSLVREKTKNKRKIRKPKRFGLSDKNGCSSNTLAISPYYHQTADSDLFNQVSNNERLIETVATKSVRKKERLPILYAQEEVEDKKFINPIRDTRKLNVKYTHESEEVDFNTDSGEEQNTQTTKLIGKMRDLINKEMETKWKNYKPKVNNTLLKDRISKLLLKTEEAVNTSVIENFSQQDHMLPKLVPAEEVEVIREAKCDTSLSNIDSAMPILTNECATDTTKIKDQWTTSIQLPVINVRSTDDFGVIKSRRQIPPKKRKKHQRLRKSKADHNEHSYSVKLNPASLKSSNPATNGEDCDLISDINDMLAQNDLMHNSQADADILDDTSISTENHTSVPEQFKTNTMEKNVPINNKSYSKMLSDVLKFSSDLSKNNESNGESLTRLRDDLEPPLKATDESNSGKTLDNLENIHKQFVDNDVCEISDNESQVYECLEWSPSDLSGKVDESNSVKIIREHQYDHSDNQSVIGIEGSLNTNSSHSSNNAGDDCMILNDDLPSRENTCSEGASSMKKRTYKNKGKRPYKAENILRKKKKCFPNCIIYQNTVLKVNSTYNINYLKTNFQPFVELTRLDSKILKKCDKKQIQIKDKAAPTENKKCKNNKTFKVTVNETINLMDKMSL